MTIPPAFFLPGWGFGCGPLKAALAAQSRWQCVDLPGCDALAGANASVNTDAPPAHFAAAVEALLAALPPVCALGGWSLGGMLALAAAEIAPERIRALFLVGATPSFLQREGWPYGRPPLELKSFQEKIRKEGAALLPRFAGSFCRGDAHPQTAQWLVQNASPMPQAALDAGLVWLAEADLRAALSRVTCPVTLMHGENDPLIPVAAARWLARRLPESRLVLIPGKAHAPFAPDAPANARFLRELPFP
ncbi:MAG: alpha/beta fold hydrolase [Zoogloeaceae bacterium]|jgi:pimeloyl-[acyl-carrier protein] methyl ester esterase|nr:alpha/beta fold hydrolase [Zoogloeaceae bacterium]